MSLNLALVHEGHVHRFVVAHDPVGWEVREEEDSTVLKRVHRQDWHRVERDARLFEITAFALKHEGWKEA